MAVTSTITLPAQPGTGSVAYIPLGGDGYTAPHAAYLISGMALAGDVSGGTARITVAMDPRYCSLASYFTGQIAQATAGDADFRWTFGTSVRQKAFESTALTVSSVSCAETWRPPPLIQPGGGDAPSLFMTYVNVDANTFFLDGLIYLFNIRAREVGPLGYLLWAQGSS